MTAKAAAGEVCLEHSGCDARITQCEKNDTEIFKRLYGLEKTVWKAAGATGVVMGLVMVLVQFWLQRVFGG